MSELEEIYLDVYENTKLYKERTKRWHDKMILNREFKEGDLVFLFNSRINIFPEKLQSWWSGSFVVKMVTLYRAVEI